jgi:hypothetical protein
MARDLIAGLELFQCVLGVWGVTEVGLKFLSGRVRLEVVGGPQWARSPVVCPRASKSWPGGRPCSGPFGQRITVVVCGTACRHRMPCTD